MTLDDIDQQLANLDNSGDPQFVQASQYISSLIQQVQNNQLSVEDMAELLRDVQRSMNIIQDAKQLVLKDQVNTVILGIFDLTGVIKY